MTSLLRSEGRWVEALLIFLKHVTAHARWVFIALLALYAASGVHTIQPGEMALVRRLGRLQSHLHGPGLLVGLPAPFDELLRFETGKDRSLPLDDWALIGTKIGDPDQPLQLSNEELTRRVQSPDVQGAEYPDYDNKTLDPEQHGYTLTANANLIQGRFTLRYRIEDPLRFAAAGEDIETLLKRLSYRAFSAELVRRPIDESLTEKRRQVAAGAAERVRCEAVRLHLGVAVIGVDIGELSPPTQVIAAFEDVTNARQFAKTLYENGRQYDAETLAKSEGEAAAIRHRAEAYVTDLLETARGEAGAFAALMQHYQRQPELVAQRLLRETLDSVMGQVSSRTLVPMKQALPTIIMEPAPEFAR